MSNATASGVGAGSSAPEHSQLAIVLCAICAAVVFIAVILVTRSRHARKFTSKAAGGVDSKHALPSSPTRRDGRHKPESDQLTSAQAAGAATITSDAVAQRAHERPDAVSEAGVTTADGMPACFTAALQSSADPTATETQGVGRVKSWITPDGECVLLGSCVQQGVHHTLMPSHVTCGAPPSATSALMAAQPEAQVELLGTVCAARLSLANAHPHLSTTSPTTSASSADSAAAIPSRCLAHAATAPPCRATGSGCEQRSVRQPPAVSSRGVPEQGTEAMEDLRDTCTAEALTHEIEFYTVRSAQRPRISPRTAHVECGHSAASEDGSEQDRDCSSPASSAVQRARDRVQYSTAVDANALAEVGGVAEHGERGSISAASPHRTSPRTPAEARARKELAADVRNEASERASLVEQRARERVGTAAASASECPCDLRSSCSSSADCDYSGRWLAQVMASASSATSAPSSSRAPSELGARPSHLPSLAPPPAHDAGVSSITEQGIGKLQKQSRPGILGTRMRLWRGTSHGGDATRETSTLPSVEASILEAEGTAGLDLYSMCDLSPTSKKMAEAVGAHASTPGAKHAVAQDWLQRRVELHHCRIDPHVIAKVVSGRAAEGAGPSITEEPAAGSAAMAERATTGRRTLGSSQSMPTIARPSMMHPGSLRRSAGYSGASYEDARPASPGLGRRPADATLSSSSIALHTPSGGATSGVDLQPAQASGAYGAELPARSAGAARRRSTEEIRAHARESIMQDPGARGAMLHGAAPEGLLDDSSTANAQPRLMLPPPSQPMQSLDPTTEALHLSRTLGIYELPPPPAPGAQDLETVPTLAAASSRASRLQRARSETLLRKAVATGVSVVSQDDRVSELKVVARH